MKKLSGRSPIFFCRRSFAAIGVLRYCIGERVAHLGEERPVTV
jgi:hypothetical protein